ncbi:MAG: cytochrome C [Alphaproteobacteria bacterium BRH_c36]|nr:MAG: cytochrome C [Alphaproteobacteria bacterium BRH_c36]
MTAYRTVVPLRSALAALATLVCTGAPAIAAGGEVAHIDRHEWSFAGFGGQYDRNQLRRGFQVYKEVCASCHALERVKFRNLVQKGGPEFDDEAVKALAAEWPNQISDGPNDEGAMFERVPKLSDKIKGPYKNEQEARSIQNGAYPPDLSLITRARSVHNEASWYIHVPMMMRDILTGYAEGGADYMYALLTGYKEAPEGFHLAEGMNYNAYFPGNQIAMIQPIPEGGAVEYQENAGAKSSLEQNAKDVTAFLAWAADPSLNERKQLGWTVMLYLIITTLLLYFAKKRIWSRVKH